MAREQLRLDSLPGHQFRRHAASLQHNVMHGKVGFLMLSGCRRVSRPKSEPIRTRSDVRSLVLVGRPSLTAVTVGSRSRRLGTPTQPVVPPSIVCKSCCENFEPGPYAMSL